MDEKKRLNIKDSDNLDFRSLWNQKLSRRSFLGKIERMTGLFAGVGLIGFFPFGLIGKTSHEEQKAPFIKTFPKYLDYPFKLGIASGDPLSDGVVLWTRLAPEPMNGGGMPPGAVDVRWEVAEDESFQNIVKQGTAVAKKEKQ